MPKHSRIYSPSAGDRRESLGEYVASGIDISVVLGPAVGAGPDTVRERQLVPGSATGPAGLGGREPTADLDHSTSIPNSLVGQLTDQFAPPSIGYRSGMQLSFHHSFAVVEASLARRDAFAQRTKESKRKILYRFSSLRLG